VSPVLEAWQVSWLIPAPSEGAGTPSVLPWLVTAGAATIARWHPFTRLWQLTGQRGNP